MHCLLEAAYIWEMTGGVGIICQCCLVFSPFFLPGLGGVCSLVEHVMYAWDERDWLEAETCMAQQLCSVSFCLQRRSVCLQAVISVCERLLLNAALFVSIRPHSLTAHPRYAFPISLSGLLLGKAPERLMMSPQNFSIVQSFLMHLLLLHPFATLYYDQNQNIGQIFSLPHALIFLFQT